MTARPRAHGTGGGEEVPEGGGTRRRGSGTHARSGNVAEAEASVTEALQGGRSSANGGKRKVTAPDPNIDPVEITVRRKPFMPKTEFRRKMAELHRLGEDGKLFKATNPVDRDQSVTRGYRQDVIDRIWDRYHDVNPDFADKLIERVTGTMQPDHVWELQLGGPDNWSNLRFLHGPTNEDIGMHQIRPQLSKLQDGTPIRIRVIDEGD